MELLTIHHLDSQTNIVIGRYHRVSFMPSSFFFHLHQHCPNPNYWYHHQRLGWVSLLICYFLSKIAWEDFSPTTIIIITIVNDDNHYYNQSSSSMMIMIIIINHHRHQETDTKSFSLWVEVDGSHWQVTESLLVLMQVTQLMMRKTWWWWYCLFFNMMLMVIVMVKVEILIMIMMIMMCLHRP